MEIVDYLRAARRRLALIILIPLVAAGGAAALLFLQKPMYVATATVDPPALVGGPTSQYTGAQGVIQFVAAFQATASGPVVRQQIADQTGVPTEDLGDRLLVTQRGGSPSVAVTYTSTEKADVDKVVEAASTLTLKTMFTSQVASAQARLDEARANLASSNEAVGAFTTQNKMADPQKAYEAQLNRVNGLTQQQASMRAAGNAVGAAAMSSPIASATAALDRFGPILNEYTSLLEARTAASAGVTSAQAQLANAKSQLDAADPTKIVFVSGARLVDSTETLTRTVIAVAVAGFLLALLFVAMLEVIDRGRRERSLAEAAAAADAAAADAGAHPASQGANGSNGAKGSGANVAPAAGSSKPGVPARAKH
ncbi:MAG TPA: Wzz/FepE/Etk N-terminal domain-containing protein [Pedococcus sp.]|jgi:uncharacterized protein involved in exopolysaccharide biosynthesis|uniref:Wzz/FepE/Etk N-terminal domain-containing protein n=1 Tax=Pedococcus sp. TaxID=2860345 RepID=UPI002F94D1BF